MKKILLLLVTFVIVRCASAQDFSVQFSGGKVEIIRVLSYNLALDSSAETRTVSILRIPESDTLRVNSAIAELVTESNARKAERQKKQQEAAKKDADIDNLKKEIEKRRKGKGAQPEGGKKEVETPAAPTTQPATQSPVKKATKKKKKQ